MLSFLNWFDTNYEKIWLIVVQIALILFVIGIISHNEVIYGMSEDLSDFYDEILSE